MNEIILNLLVAFGLSLIITAVYLYVNRKNLNEEMLLTLLLLPVIVSAIIYTIGENVAGAFSLAGIFSIVRFRSTQSSPKDITFILFGVGAGLTTSAGLYTEGLILIVFGSIIILLYELFNTQKKQQMLKILVPEELKNTNEIENVLKRYTQNYYLEEICTKDLGSLFEMKYKINMNKKDNNKDLIDELRVLNGNLTIKISEK